MTKQELLKYIDKEFATWDALEDDELAIAELIEIGIAEEILNYAIENDLEVDGLNISELLEYVKENYDEDYSIYDEEVEGEYRSINCIFFKLSDLAHETPKKVSEELISIVHYYETRFWPESWDE